METEAQISTRDRLSAVSRTVAYNAFPPLHDRISDRLYYDSLGNKTPGLVGASARAISVLAERLHTGLSHLKKLQRYGRRSVYVRPRRPSEYRERLEKLVEGRY